MAKSQYSSVKDHAVLRMRKVGTLLRLTVPRWEGFFEGNFDTRFLTTRGLLLGTRGVNFSSKISAVNQAKKGESFQAVLVET